MRQSRKETFRTHFTVTRSTLKNLVENTAKQGTADIHPISTRAVIRYNSERVQIEADPKLNRSFSMRHKVDFRSSQYLSSPDESQDKKGLNVLVLLSLLAGGADQAGLSSLVEEAVIWVLLLSCAKSFLAAVSIPPETAETASILAA